MKTETFYKVRVTLESGYNTPLCFQFPTRKTAEMKCADLMAKYPSIKADVEKWIRNERNED